MGKKIEINTRIEAELHKFTQYLIHSLKDKFLITNVNGDRIDYMDRFHKNGSGVFTNFCVIPRDGTALIVKVHFTDTLYVAIGHSNERGKTFRSIRNPEPMDAKLFILEYISDFINDSDYGDLSEYDKNIAIFKLSINRLVKLLMLKDYNINIVEGTPVELTEQQATSYIIVTNEYPDQPSIRIGVIGDLSCGAITYQMSCVETEETMAILKSCSIKTVERTLKALLKHEYLK